MPVQLIPFIIGEITMSGTTQRLSALSALALSLALLGGCATTADLQEARSSADEAAAEARQARTEARQAHMAAEQATRTANEARDLAAEANRKADTALEETARLREAMDRMYERGTSK
jgi:methyl-accepting chemotaxis protein